MDLKTLKELVKSLKDSDKTAITDRKEYRRFSYTYRELYLLSQKFAAFLKNKDVKKGDCIIVWSPNGIEYAVVMLGAFLRGAVLVPIDLRSNIDFVKDIAKQVRPKIVFQTRYKPKANRSFFMEELLDTLEGIGAEEDTTTVNGNDLAEILYTSGTTGNPKGVMLTHRNIISNVISVNATARLFPKQTFLSVLPLSHVFEQVAGFLVLLSNRTTIVYLKTLKTRDLFEAFQDEQITNAAVVPRLLELIHTGILQKVKNKEKFTSLVQSIGKLPLMFRRAIFNKIHKKFGGRMTYFVCGGAPLDESVEKFYDAIGMRIVQGYGLTESSPVLTTNTPVRKKTGSVGKALPGVNIKISASGEVLAKGDNITQGYYKNPKKTKELFEDSWLKTGDLGYLDDEGNLFLKGRKKDMIVTSAGINVYPEDIEHVLNRLPGVRDSCVIGTRAKNGEEIHAALLLKEETDPAAMVAAANQKLDGSQKIQHHSVWPHEDFPRTTTMKIKKFVVKQAVEKESKTIGVVNSKNKVHKILSQLTRKKIAKDSTLQQLGLSSLDRVEMISLLEQEFNIEIDEENILPTTKVNDIERTVKERKTTEKRDVFRRYALSYPTRALRLICQKAILFPFVWIFTRPTLEGEENLKGLEGPAIFVANHQSYFDGPVVLMKLPLLLSQNMAIATWQEFFFTEQLRFRNLGRRALFSLLTTVFNIYPFPQHKGYKRSMKYTGKLLDKGWNVMFFPEGKRTLTGKMNRFKQGIGMLAVEMNVPVVPMKLEGLTSIYPRGKTLPGFGTCKVKIGEPIRIKKKSYVQATDMIEKAVRSL
ncbi:MAG: AMP-binding protein [Candidatus Woesearchaeota archaeon]